MSRYAAINASNVVLAVAEWDGAATWDGPDGTVSKILLNSGEECGEGYTYSAGGSPRFTAPAAIDRVVPVLDDSEYLVAATRTKMGSGRLTVNSTSVTIDKSKAGEIEFRRAALTGDVTASANSNATTIANDAVTTAKIANNAVTLAKLQNITTERLLGRDSVGTGAVEQIAVTGGIEFSDVGSIQIADNGITFAKMQDVSAASRLLGRGSASGAGDPQEITLGTGLTMTGTTLSSSGGSTVTITETLYTSNGTHTPSANCKYIFILASGAGGCGSNASTTAGGVGGGAGQYVETVVPESAFTGNTLTVTIGAGGVVGVSGGAGSETTVTATTSGAMLCYAYGGLGASATARPYGTTNGFGAGGATGALPTAGKHGGGGAGGGGAGGAAATSSVGYAGGRPYSWEFTSTSSASAAAAGGGGAAGASGGGAGGNADAANDRRGLGEGGGGGGSNGAGAGGNGGNGRRGSGGGGGGRGTTAGGTGGTGGDGFVRIIEVQVA